MGIIFLIMSTPPPASTSKFVPIGYRASGPQLWQGHSEWMIVLPPAATFVFMKIPTVAKLFDHSILRPETNRHELLSAAETAVRLKTATLMVQPCYLQAAGEILKGSGMLLASVIGFPHGNETASIKEYQTKEALRLGAQEIDMVEEVLAFLKAGARRRGSTRSDQIIRAYREMSEEIRLISHHLGVPQKLLRGDIPLELCLAGETRHRICFQSERGDAELLAFDERRPGAAERIEHLMMGIQTEFGDVFPNQMRRK